MSYTDCNNCPMISMTEARQRLIEHGSDLPHFCTVTGMQLKHSSKYPAIPVPENCPLNGEINHCSSVNKQD